ncbi:hypothetical protein Esti_004450 [Eimeria stiedai]
MKARITVGHFEAQVCWYVHPAWTTQMVMNIQLPDSRSEDWCVRSGSSVAKSSVVSPPLSGGACALGCPVRSFSGISRPSYIRSDASSISRGPPCSNMSGLSPEKGASREPPRMGEGGNWQCHICLNVNYPRRTACNRCLAERNKENTQKVTEFVRLKEGFLQMGLDQHTASAAAAAQQAAHSSSNNGGSSGMNSESAERRLSANNSSKTSSSGNVLALEGGGLGLLSYPLEPQQPFLQRPASFDQKVLQRMLQQTDSRLLPNAELSKHQQVARDLCTVGGLSSRETSGGLLRSSSDISNNAASSSVFDEDGAAGAPSRQQETLLGVGQGSSGKSNKNSDDVNFIMLRAGVLLGKLLQEFDGQGDQQKEAATAATLANPPAAAAARADDVLRAALGMLAGTTSTGTADRQQQVSPCLGLLDSLPSMQQPYRPSQLGYPQMLAHPDEFRNPSSFLKIYGDPLCSLSPPSAAALIAGNTNSPTANRNGNWVCGYCNNINFPRRFRCNKCNELRGPEGDKIVAEYARAVYAHHTERLRTQQIQQQLHLLKQQDLEQMQTQLQNAQAQQQRPHIHHRQRLRTAPSPSSSTSPAGGASSCAPKPFGHAVAAAAAAASVAAARPTETAVLTLKTGVSPRIFSSNPGASSCSLMLPLISQEKQRSEKLQQEKEQQVEKQQLLDKQRVVEKRQEEKKQPLPAAATAGAALVAVNANDQ